MDAKKRIEELTKILNGAILALILILLMGNRFYMKEILLLYLRIKLGHYKRVLLVLGAIIVKNKLVLLQ